MPLVPRWRLSLKARAAWTIFLAAYSGGVGIIILLDRILKPTTAMWVHNKTVLITLVSVLAVLTFLDALKRAVHRVRGATIDKNRVGIRNQLASVIVTVAKMHGIDSTELGCGLFLLQGRGLRRPERLVRVERVRLINDLHESTVVYTIGKGTVGECWKNQAHAHHEWSAINRKWHDDIDKLRSRWGRMPVTTTRDFSENEFVSLLGKYSEVLAVPVMIDGKFEGCLALDRRWNKDDASDRSLLDHESTRSAMGTAAETLRPLLRKT